MVGQLFDMCSTVATFFGKLSPFAGANMAQVFQSPNRYLVANAKMVCKNSYVLTRY